VATFLIDCFAALGWLAMTMFSSSVFLVAFLATGFFAVSLISIFSLTSGFASTVFSGSTFSIFSVSIFSFVGSFISSSVSICPSRPGLAEADEKDQWVSTSM